MEPAPIRGPLDVPAWREHLRLNPRPVSPVQSAGNAPASPVQGAVSVPSVARQARSVTAAWLRWRQAGCPKRSREEIHRIAAICETCAFGGDRHPVFRYKRCRKCGCSRVKLGWATEHCPLKPPKW